MNIKMWREHNRQLIEGKVVSIATEIKKEGKRLIESKPKKRGFVATPNTVDDFTTYMAGLINDLKAGGNEEVEGRRVAMEDEINDFVDYLINGTKGLREKYVEPQDSSISPKVLREQKLLDLGLKFVEVASYGDIPLARAYLKAGFPVNFQHPRTKMTALHYACAHIKHPPDFILLLLEREDCDLLIKDRQGRIPYEMIYRFGYDIDLAEKIREKTLEQAAERGVKVDFGFEVKINPAPEDSL